MTDRPTAAEMRAALVTPETDPSREPTVDEMRATLVLRNAAPALLSALLDLLNPENRFSAAATQNAYTAIAKATGGKL